MPSISLKAPPEPFACGVCDKPVFADKEGPSCARCPAFRETHYFPRSVGREAPDLLVVGDVPEVPDKRSLLKLVESGAVIHEAFSGDAGQVIKSAITKVQSSNSDYTRYAVRYVYGVKCAAPNPNKSVISSCQGPFQNELARVFVERTGADKTNKLVILACGVVGLKAVGVNVGSFEEAAGRVFEISIGDRPVTVVATMSLKAIAAAVGKYSSVVADVERAFGAISKTGVKPVSREELEANYVYPTSLDDVRRICDEIANYSEGDVPPEKWIFSFDTETNTLHPHRDGTKLLMVSMAWTAGRATAIPLWHPENNKYDPAAAWEIVKALLKSKKPKVLHNAKYDIKVVWKYGGDINNIGWDCMLAEHALEEDKKGQYGLKYLVRQFLPKYSGYEDQLHEILVKNEGEDQRQSIGKTVGIEDLPLPQLVRDALERVDLPPTFRPATLEKHVAGWTRFLEGPAQKDQLTKADLKGVDSLLRRIFQDAALTPEARREEVRKLISAGKLLLAAKAAGEFSAKPKKEAKKKIEGGYESIPLKELAFYAAVDADATRQLAIQQFKRMAAEDQQIAKTREEVRIQQRYNRGQGSNFPVVVLTDDPRPLVRLTREGYVPRSRELARMEYGGVRVNRAYLEDATVKLDHVIREQEELIYTLAGARFNINSTAQLGSYLFDTGVGYLPRDPERAEALARDPLYSKKITWTRERLMFRPELYTERGKAQVNEATLKIYATKYGSEFADAILVYRKAIKARDTFLGNVRDLSSLDGFLHTSYNLNGTSTGRLSSNNMNMQNIPKGNMGAIPDSDPRAARMSKVEREGVKCKKLFIPDDDSMCFINADAKGAEVSMFAGYAMDHELIEALRAGMDAHCFFSSEVLNPAKVGAGLTGDARKFALQRAGIDDEHAWTYEDFLLGKDDKLDDRKYGARLKKLRDNIKRVVFGILFGAGANKIAEIAGIEPEFAQTIIQLLFSKFPTIPYYSELTKWELRTFGFVETRHGRRRRFAVKNAPRKLLSQAERRAVNFKIQGTNSDIVMDVLTWIAPIIERDLRGRCLLTVHDSIGFQVPKKYAHQVKDLMYRYGTEEVARRNPWLPVQYKWDVEAGPDYGSVMPIDAYLAKLEPELRYEAAGYTEEEIFEALRSAVTQPSMRS